MRTIVKIVALLLATIALLFSPYEILSFSSVRAAAFHSQREKTPVAADEKVLAEAMRVTGSYPWRFDDGCATVLRPRSHPLMPNGDSGDD